MFARTQFSHDLLLLTQRYISLHSTADQRYGTKPLAAQWTTSAKCICLCMDELHSAPLTTDILSVATQALNFLFDERNVFLFNVYFK